MSIYIVGKIPPENFHGCSILETSLDWDEKVGVDGVVRVWRFGGGCSGGFLTITGCPRKESCLKSGLAPNADSSCSFDDPKTKLLSFF